MINKEDFEILTDDPQEMRAEKRNTKASCWLGTWNNPKMTDNEFFEFLQKLEEENILQYAIFQREKGEECGTEHFQFFLNFKNARYFNWIKQLLPYGCHFKPMISTKTACKDYCSKPDTRISENFYEVGEFIDKGGRTDLAKIIELVNNGATFREISKLYPTQAVMYSRQIKELEQMKLEEENENTFRKLNVVYIWGKTATGKTRFVMEKYGYTNVYRICSYTHPFDKYKNQKVLLLDEFRSSLKITEMLELLDGYPAPLKCRYQDKVACFTQVYIISNIPLTEQYKNIQAEESATWKAFLRRIHSVINFDNPNDKQKLINGESVQLSLLPIEEMNDIPF